MLTSADVSIYLQYLQRRSGLSQQQWAEASGVPAYTVSRLLSGSIYSPPLPAVAALVLAANGSLDEMAGIDFTNPASPPNAQDTIDRQDTSIVYLKDQITFLQTASAEKDARLEKLRRCLSIRNFLIGLLVLLLGALAAIDLLDSSYGFLYRVVDIAPREGALFLRKG